MKVLSAIILLAAIVATTAENQCPEKQKVDWEIEMLLPHKDCDKFYQCTHGKPVEMPCPKGLFYNTTESLCDWKENVDCGDRNIPEEETEEPEVTPGPDDNDSFETEKPEFPIIDFLPNGCPVDPEVQWLLPHERNCRYFYYCYKGKRILRQCVLGLYFNKESQICDWRWNANC